jgi:hypothetical protein
MSYVQHMAESALADICAAICGEIPAAWGVERASELASLGGAWGELGRQLYRVLARR